MQIRKSGFSTQLRTALLDAGEGVLRGYSRVRLLSGKNERVKKDVEGLLVPIESRGEELQIYSEASFFYGTERDLDENISGREIERETGFAQYIAGFTRSSSAIYRIPLTELGLQGERKTRVGALLENTGIFERSVEVLGDLRGASWQALASYLKGYPREFYDEAKEKQGFFKGVSSEESESEEHFFGERRPIRVFNPVGGVPEWSRGLRHR